MKVSASLLKPQFDRYSEQYLAKAKQVLESGWYVMGPEVKAFEQEFANYHHAKYCVGVASGLDALVLSFHALGLEQGGEVIAPANTYIASIMGFTKVGLVPRFVEPDAFFNLDANKIEEAINDKTVAICAVHLYGQCADMVKIMEIAKKHHLKVVEDCAQAHGALLNGQMVGTFGDLGAYSFYPTKNLGAFGDGGAVITNDKDLADKVRMLRNYGSKEHYYFETVGYNSRLDELQAGLLRVKLTHIDELIEERRQIAAWYDQGITNPLVIKPRLQFDLTSHVYHQYVVMVESRDDFRRYLKDHGVDTLIHYPQPPHLSKAYAYLGYKPGDFPITEHYANTVVSLPMYNGLTKAEVDYVIDVINGYNH